MNEIIPKENEELLDTNWLIDSLSEKHNTKSKTCALVFQKFDYFPFIKRFSGETRYSFLQWLLTKLYPTPEL